MNKETGGPAFPEVVTEFNTSSEEREVTSTGGMKLRDYFAAKALTGVLHTCASMGTKSGKPPTELDFAMQAYAFADAMLQARKL